MQSTFAAFTKLAVLAIVANTATVVAAPEPVGLEARQSKCLLKFCTPGTPNGCCEGASCAGLRLLDLPVPGVCAPSSCAIICSETVPCCTDVPGTTFSCQLIPGQTVGVCIPQAV